MMKGCTAIGRIHTVSGVSASNVDSDASTRSSFSGALCPPRKMPMSLISLEYGSDVLHELIVVLALAIVR